MASPSDRRANGLKYALTFFNVSDKYVGVIKLELE